MMDCGWRRIVKPPLGLGFSFSFGAFDSIILFLVTTDANKLNFVSRPITEQFLNCWLDTERKLS